MEELDYKFQKQSSLSASSQNHFTSLSWNWKRYALMTGLSKPTSSQDYSTSVCGKFNIKNKIAMLFQIATKS